MKKIRYVPYGYTVRDGETVVEHSEANIIREIFQAYISGASLKAIAEELTGRNIPYTEKNTTWDKARIARIIDNSKYIGTEEYAPIVDEELYEAATSLKVSRQRNAMEKECDGIELLRDFIRCECCGQPMKRHISTKCRIKESWDCSNDACGHRVRISDAQLLETITVILNRIIQNGNLLQPQAKKRYEPSPGVIKIGNEIAMELEQAHPSEDYIISKTAELASLMYEQNTAKLDVTVSLARKMVQAMRVQEEFNKDYFMSLVSYITLGENGKVTLHTKTETEVSLDDGSH